MILSIAKAPKTLQQREATDCTLRAAESGAVSSAELSCALGQLHKHSRSDSPIYDELVIGCGLVTHRAHPCRLLLVHLQVEHGVKALQVCAGLCTARH